MSRYFGGSGATTMVTPILSGTGYTLSLNNTVTRYTQLINGGTWSNTYAGMAIAVPGTFKNLRVNFGGSGWAGGKSWTLKLFKNGVATALACAFDNDQTLVVDDSNTFTVVAGDTVALGLVPVSAPTNPTSVEVSFAFQATGATFISTGGGATTSATGYHSVGVPGFGDATDAIAAQICAVAGTIDNLYITETVAPGSGKSRVYTLYKNGSPTSLTCTIADAAKTASDTNAAHAVTVAAGDLLSLESVPSGTPAAATALGSMRLTPTTLGESPICACGGAYSTTATRYSEPNTSMGTGSTSRVTVQAPVAFTLKKHYVALSTAPGASKSRTSRSNNASGYGNLSAQVTGAATTTASDTGNSDSVAVGDGVGFACDVSNTPAAITWIKQAAVQFITPT